MAEDYTITTVTAAATSFNLTTLLAVKADLNINDATSQTNILLQRLIAQCSSAATSYCNRVFPLQTYLDTIRLRNGADVLMTRRHPVTQIVSILEDTTALIVSNDYEFDADNGLIRRLDGSGLPSKWTGDKKVAISYKAGWILPGTPALASTLPADLEDAVIRMVKSRYLARERDPFLKAERVDGVGSVDYWVAAGTDGNMTPDVSDVLDNYRIPAIG